jgi:hypothetical protein
MLRKRHDELNPLNCHAKLEKRSGATSQGLSTMRITPVSNGAWGKGCRRTRGSEGWEDRLFQHPASDRGIRAGLGADHCKP